MSKMPGSDSHYDLYGCSLKLIKILISFKGVEHRIEYVDTVEGVQFFNDSKATNVDAAIIGIKAMKRPIVLIGGGMDKGADFTEWVNMFPDRVKTSRFNWRNY